jgi:hypothetical protein
MEPTAIVAAASAIAMASGLNVYATVLRLLGREHATSPHAEPPSINSALSAHGTSATSTDAQRMSACGREAEIIRKPVDAVRA